MTHSLHRLGDRESLCQDFVLLAVPARGFNLEGSGEKMRRICSILSNHRGGLVNYGNLTRGNSHRTTLEELKAVDSRMIHAVFKDRETLKACLQEIRAADLGISIVASGLKEEICKICEEIGLTPHTANFSLEFHGRTQKLPPTRYSKLSPCAAMPWSAKI